MSVAGKTSSQSPQFSPTDLPGLSLWLDGKDTNTVFQDVGGTTPVSSAGQTVRYWRDKSGRGCNATQSGNAPVWNSSGSLTFAHASSQFLRLPDSTLPSSSVTGTYSIFAVTNPTVASRNLTILCSGSAGTNQFNGLQIQSDGRLMNIWFNSDVGGGSVALNSFFLGSMHYDGATRTVFVAGSNVNTTAGTGWAGTISNNVIGIESATNNWGFSGDIGEVVVYSTALTTAQRQAVEGHLARKWNLSSMAGHPYRAGGSGIGPTSIPGCLLWLDAADATSIDLSGTTVTTWRDKSGNANHFTPRSGTPTYSSSQVSIPSGTVMRSAASITMSLNVYAVVVFRLTSTADGYVISFPNMSPGGFTGDYSIRTGSGILNGTPTMPYGNEGDFGGQGNYYVNGNFNPSFGASTYSVPVIVSAKSMNASMTGSTTIELSTTSMAPRYFVGSMYEVILYSSPLTTLQRQQLEGYLANKWGLSQSLPASTAPYASAMLSMRPFSPIDVGTCSLWLDGGDRSTMTLTGSNVTTWRDKSGNGYTVTNSGTGATVSSNGLVFAGEGVYGGTASYLHSPTNGTWTAFAVFTASTTSIGNPRILNYPGFGQWIYIESTRFNTYIPPQVSGSVVSVNTPYIASVLNDPSATTIRVNGVFDASGAHGTLSTTSGSSFIVGGADITWTGDRFYGTLSEILVFSNALTSGDRQQVEAYLAGKWGLRGSMGPAAHPYRYGAAAITPTSIPGCALWLDAADSTTLTLSGGNVTSWADKSGNGRNASTALGTLALSSNSLVFTGTQAMTTPLTSVATTQTVFAVTSTNTSLYVDILGIDAPDGGPNGLQFNMSNFTQTLARFGGTLVASGGSVSQNVTFLGGFTYISGGNTFLYLNGSQTGSNASSPAISGSGTVVIGAFRNNSAFNERYDGRINEIVMYHRVLTTIERQQVEGYLAWKWGLSSNLPGVSPLFARLYQPLLPIFMPLHTASCSFWLDSADRSTLTLSGSNVTSWADKSGSGFTATVSSNAFATLSTTGLVFSNSFYTTSYSASPANETFFTVFTTPGTLVASSNGLIGTQTGGRTILVPGWGPNSNAFGMNNSGVAGGAGVTGLVANARYIGVIQITGTSTTAAINGNSPSAPVTITAFTSGRTTTLGRETATQYAFNGVVHELLAYTASLTTAQRQQVEGYLAWKWGLLASLPSTHPYKTFKP